jgi:hypothetical protein
MLSVSKSMLCKVAVFGIFRKNLTALGPALENRISNAERYFQFLHVIPCRTKFRRERLLLLAAVPLMEKEGPMPDKQERQAARHGILGKYAYAWLTLGFFAISLFLHWYFGWKAFVNEAAQHGQVPDVSEYLTVMMRDTFENWQSEFLQLLWQVVGLAYFLYVGSPASKENDDRMEAKIDELIRLQAGSDADALLERIDRDHLRTEGHARPHGYER